MSAQEDIKISGIQKLKKLIPVGSDRGPLGLSRRQREWAQVTMWVLRKRGIREKREIKWSEIYSALSEMRQIHRTFQKHIGPARTIRRGDRKITKEEIELTRKILLLGDVDCVIDFYWGESKLSDHFGLDLLDKIILLNQFGGDLLQKVKNSCD